VVTGTTYKIQIRRSIVELQRQDIVGERHEEQRPLAHASFTEHTCFLKQLIRDNRTSWYPEDGELVLDLTLPPYPLNLIWPLSVSTQP
jgi:hypothetical protein